MATMKDVLELEIALKRKLLNTNKLKRNHKKTKYPDVVLLATLKKQSKILDKAYSGCINLKRSTELDTSFTPQYFSFLEIYKNL